MTLSEIIEDCASKSGLSQAETRKALSHFFDIVRSTVLASGEEVKIPNFGKFTRRSTKARMVFGRMSADKESIRFSPYSSSINAKKP